MTNDKNQKALKSHETMVKMSVALAYLLPSNTYTNYNNKAAELSIELCVRF